MAKMIHMTQQAPYNYMPLRAGLGQITHEELKGYWLKKGIALGFAAHHRHTGVAPGWPELCPKTCTTHTRPLSGEYVVAEGNRSKAQLVEPRIEFVATPEFNFTFHGPIPTLVIFWEILGRSNLTYPECELGIVGAPYAQLQETLLRSNKKATLETRFYVNLVKPLERSRNGRGI